MNKTNSFHVLIIEDTASLARMYETGLAQHNYKTTCVVRAEDAINLLKKNSYDLILLDIHLPDMSGLKAMEEFKKIKLKLWVDAVEFRALWCAAIGKREIERRVREKKAVKSLQSPETKKERVEE